jgi:nicotinamidase/pyrazinamidase
MPTTKLLLIDPQNDFCDIPGAALPVPGAGADMRRLAAFITEAAPQLADIIVTLDSHPAVAIERTPFWHTASGAPAAAFTTITHAQVLAGEYLPHEAPLLPQVLAYLKALEAGGHFTLMVWPVHCVIGTWGHNIQSHVGEAIRLWEQGTHRASRTILKGLNPLTEQYSAVRAEVPRSDDPATQTNRALIAAALPTSGLLFVAGEALSHCVAATLDHLFAEMTLSQRERVVLLTDCMSPVAGFGSEFLDRARQLGARALPSHAALALLQHTARE